MAAWTEVATIKSSLYLNIASVTDYDAQLLSLIESVTDQMINYLDDTNDTIDNDSPPVSLKRACALQCSYEWKRRGDKGLTSVTYQDGQINKYETKEWLTEVKQILDRYMEMEF